MLPHAYRLFLGTDLQGADLHRANLHRVNLHRVNLDGVKADGVKADEDTHWPEGFDPVAAGVVID
ncbi:MAG: pentapeptide repeat-containing protein [Actinomycetota bacterium]|nr:pentapeptide repeat-containing protein [Actinomycetota bacterium]